MGVLSVMSFKEFLGEIIFCLAFGGCFSMYVGLLVMTIGLRELQTNLKIREIGKNVLKKFF